jgi:phage shock protein C
MKLHRNEDDAVIGGVCAGLEECLNIDVSIIRIIFLLLFFFTNAPSFIIYLIMWMVIPAKN